MPKKTTTTEKQTVPDSGTDPKQPDAPQSVDLLRVRAYMDPFASDEVLRARLIASIVGAVADISNMRLQDVARFIDVLQNDRGSTTPAEEFIGSLVMDCYRDSGEGLTPETAAERLEKFREDFEDALWVTKRFNRVYAETLKQAEDAR